MGSNCSSRQSQKDSISIKSEDSQNEENESYEKVEKKSEEKPLLLIEKTKLRDKGGTKSVESDFSSFGDDGTGVGTPLSSTVSAPGAPDGLMKGSLPEKESKKEELPDLSSLKTEISILLEGRNSEGQIGRGSKYCVFILGKLDECGKGTKDVIKTVNEEISTNLNEKGIEALLINVHLSVALYNTPFSPSELLSEYIKEQNCFSSIFVILLRGTNPETYDLPTHISEGDFSVLIETLDEKESKDLIEKWYVKDQHRESFRKLQPAPTIYKQLLSEKTEEYNKAYEMWAMEHSKLINIFIKIQDQKKLTLRLPTTVQNDLELVKEISAEVPFRVILIRKDAKKTPTEDKTDQFLQTLVDDESIRDLAKETFSNRSCFDILRPKISSNEFTDEWWKEVSSALTSTVMDCIQSSPAYPKTKKFNLMEEGINDKLLKEISSHLNFPATFQCGTYSSHDNYLTKAQKYVMGTSSKPLLITGSTGVGKSFLISQISKTCREWKPDTCVMTRFVGATENSTTIDGLIYYLVEQELVTHGFPSNFDCLDMYSNLKAILKKASNSRPIILLLHGMDKLVSDKTSTSRFIDILFELPENVKVILTAREGSAFQEEFSHKINDDESIIKIGSLNEGTSEKLLNSFMISNKQELSDSLWDNIKSKQNSSATPLYFFILSQLLLTGTSEHKNCNSSLENEIEYFFKSLQDIFTKAILQTVLGCLALTRIGLLEKEILSIIELSHSPAVRSPILEWFYLRRLLKPLLLVRREKSLILISLQSSIRNSVAKFFLDSEEKNSKCFDILRNVIFKNEESKILDIPLEEYQKESLKHIRALQLSSLMPWKETQDKKMFFNLKWLYKLVEASGPFKVLEELDLVIATCSSDSELLILREILELSSYSLLYDSSQFFSQIYGRLKWRLTDPESFPHLSALITGSSESPLPCLLPLSPCFSSTHQEKPTEEGGKENLVHINSIFRIPGNPHHVIAVSTSKGRVTVCNIINMEVVRTLVGINQPRTLEMIDDYKCLLLCGRELRIFNLNEGSFLMKLREVMNQKMPFFGLRDSDHVVSLSRNRMYVNMMNLTEGNCVTTFKVGEDRFLNSLLVSENGKICVCGDDTQKPSALLVWDLQLRKLMYDLRIPHHEFATRLAAITLEGHYVCCVCKEVNEPAPNFIVVYDLQSGTLFKRWKPEVNTISITISTAGTCVIVGLEDSSVMAFDLITGNRRWTVFGHTSPPDTFRLDKQGLVLLSYDSQGRDRSLRVWDVHTGESFATLTPDRKISGCEITGDGKAVVIALDGIDSIYTFLLLHNEDPSKITSNLVPYGDEEYKGKVEDFSQA